MAHILVIDDEPILLDLVATILRLDSHLVTALPNAPSAYGFLKNDHTAIDLILTDVTLEQINGFEMVRCICQMGFDGPVLFMSGYSAHSEAIPESPAGCAIIEKPFTASELREAVARSLKKCRSNSSCAA